MKMELNTSCSYNRSKISCIILLFSFYLINLINSVSSNEVLGCGGFIKSHTDIDFSKIEIKLYTKQGSLKDKTDCSPSNGYYFLPVYDKGEYILQISPPSGWSFEPEQVELNFNGKTDICSQGKDVNFIFKGFGITGKVYLVGQKNDGMKDVIVELQTDKGNELRKTVTDSNGVFSFTPIIPGKYLIKASHNRWYFSKSVYEVTVESGNTEIPENSLVVSGFDVEGKIGNNGQKFNSVIIGLFKEKIQTFSSNCNNKNMIKTLPPSSLELLERKSNYDVNAICFTRSDKNGIFVFNGVAPGKYILLPIVESTDLKLNINPDILELNVERDVVILKDVFEIIGFSVSGKVLSSLKGNGISNAEIKLNDQFVAKTDVDGNFMLENIKTGFYTIKVTSDYYKFNDQAIEISLNSPSVSNIIASTYKVCGQVMSEDSHVIGITKDDKTFQINLSTDPATGEWCTFLPSGKYFVKVLATENDRANGIQRMFFPLKQTIDVHDSPISGILFSQLRVTLNGEIKCLPDSSSNCKNVEVTLQAINSVGSLTSDTYVTSAKNGKYEFVNILPGAYEISVPQSNLCWESTKALLNIMTVTETAPPFIHKGYEVSIISSHRTKVQYTLRSSSRKPSSSALPISATKPKIMNLMSGVNTFCVDYPGDYDIEFLGCHKYDINNVPKKFSTDDKNPVIVTAIAHSVGIRILSAESNIDSFDVLYETKSNKEIIHLTKDSKKIDGYYSYSNNLYLKPEDTVILKPQSNLMLFKPESKEITGSNDCIDNAFSFIAIKGLIINGKIVPAIEDVKITMNFPKNPDMLSLQTSSSANGEFNFGPIDGNLDFDLNAEKESYIFSKFDRSTNTFKANKLCDVIVTVKDEYNKTLSGVLLSLSGGESYRKNLITDNDGIIKFHSLSPNNYFLKPMMKEYKFDPVRKTIDVKNGEIVHVKLIGKRIAFSVFGTITSLNGDVFPNVGVEAISDKNCGHHQEESSSEINGQYRIRGLQPDCTYTIRVKQDSNVNRSIPSSRIIKIGNDDVKNVNLIAISPVGVVDAIARVYASPIEHYKTLRIQMYRKGSADSPIYSQRIDSPIVKNTQSNNYLNPGVIVFFPRLPLDDKIYFIELKTTLSDRMYKYQLPIVQFISNTSSIYVELNFQPEIKTSDSDLNQNSISALLLIILIGIAFFKQDLAINSFNFIWNHINNLIEEFLTHLENKKKNSNKHNEQINYKEIEQIAEGINAVKKKKAKKI